LRSNIGAPVDSPTPISICNSRNTAFINSLSLALKPIPVSNQRSVVRSNSAMK
jgi:hypothetical protein